MHVLIAGAGPGGLAMDNGLEKAGIPYTLLEMRPETIVVEGAAIGIWPHCVRILDQLGMFTEADRLAHPLEMSTQINPQGHFLCASNLFEMLADNHGHRIMFFERVKFLRMMYENVGDNSRILTEKKVVGVEQDEDGVTVTCADGSTYKGDILVGADGTYSATRKLVFPGAWSRNQCSFSYRCMFGVSPLPKGVSEGHMIEVHGRGVLFQAFTAPGKMMWLLYERVERQEKSPVRYTEADTEAMAEKFRNHPVWEGGNTTFWDVWSNRKRAGLTTIEEGIAEPWSSGHVVLTGDAIHRVAPNLALGGNSVLEDSALLINGLRKLCLDPTERQASPNPEKIDTMETAHPSLSSVTTMLSAWETERKRRYWFQDKVGGLYIRFATWENPVFEALSRRVRPVSGDQIMADNIFARIGKGGVKFDFLEEPKKKAGKVVYDDEVKAPSERAKL